MTGRLKTRLMFWKSRNADSIGNTTAPQRRNNRADSDVGPAMPPPQLGTDRHEAIERHRLLYGGHMLPSDVDYADAAADDDDEHIYEEIELRDELSTTVDSWQFVRPAERPSQANVVRL